MICQQGPVFLILNDLREGGAFRTSAPGATVPWRDANEHVRALRRY
jgi:hypothetical protein